jgi:hypothetical protein
MKRPPIIPLFLCIVVLLGTQNAAAQKHRRDRSDRIVELGVRAGVLSQALELDAAGFKNPTDPEKYDQYLTDDKVGFNVAVASRIRLFPIGRNSLDMGLYFQPEIIFGQNDLHIRPQNGYETGALTKIRIQTVDLPVMLSFKANVVRIQAGPVFNLMYRSDTRSGDIDIMPVGKPVVSYSVGVSIDVVAGLVIDGRYNGQFKDLTNNIKAGETVYDNVPATRTSWSIGVSYYF